ncbi:MAG: protein kinase [Oscillospiraceae bacterium]|nr:protein kinase [Oscillospiraceae bacterium]
MANLNFDPDNTLAGGLYAMTPQEIIRLGVALCDAVEAAVGADGAHGGVRPGNITAADGAVALGPVNHAKISEMEPDMLEYVAPEQFWNGESTPASDVYAIGLLLYTALNRGAMPFFGPEEQHSPEERATALQNRMKGVSMPYPATAGRALGDVVRRATAFRPEERYATPGQLKAALQSLPEGAEVPAAVPVVPLTAAEAQNMPSYKVDKDFEKTEPPKEKPKRAKKPKRAGGEVDEEMDAKTFRGAEPEKRSRRGIVVPIILGVAVIVALVLLLRACQSDGDVEGLPVIQETPAVTETDNPIHAAVPETPLPGMETMEPATPDDTDTDGEADTDEPDEEPEPTYELVLADVTWTQAKALCEEMGGHLVTVESAEEMQTVIALAEENSAQFVWLGAQRESDGVWRYVTGEEMTYVAWDSGEPTVTDSDGTAEDYLLLWYRPAVGTWSCNDTRNDPISVLPATYSGKIAYICEYD